MNARSKYSSDALLSARREARARLDARMDELAGGAFHGDVLAARELLPLIAEQIEDGLPLPFFVRRYLANALRFSAADYRKAAHAFALVPRKGAPPFSKERIFKVVMEIGRLHDRKVPLKRNRTSEGAFVLAAKTCGVSADFAEREWKRYRKLARAYGSKKQGTK